MTAAELFPRILFALRAAGDPDTAAWALSRRAVLEPIVQQALDEREARRAARSASSTTPVTPPGSSTPRAVPLRQPTVALADDQALNRALQELQRLGIQRGKVYHVPETYLPDDSHRPERWIRVDSIDPVGRIVITYAGLDQVQKQTAPMANFREFLSGAVELPGGFPATPPAVYLDKLGLDGRTAENKALKAVLQAMAPGVKWSVRGGTGTSWGWTSVRGDPATPGALRATQTLGLGTFSRGSDATTEQHRIKIPAEYVELARRAGGVAGVGRPEAPAASSTPAPGGQFSVYAYSPTRWAVQLKPEGPWLGDYLFSTQAEAEQAADLARRQAESSARMRAAAEQERAAEAAEAAERVDFDGWEATLTPMERGRAAKALVDRTYKAEGDYANLRTVIRKAVQEGARIERARDGSLRLVSPDGGFRDEGIIGKMGMRYAAFLVAKRDDELAGEATPLRPAAPPPPPDPHRIDEDLQVDDDVWRIHQKIDKARALVNAGRGAELQAFPMLTQRLIAASYADVGPQGTLIPAIASPTRALPDDIPLSQAILAHEGTSQFPEQRGRSAQAGYAETFNKWAKAQLAKGTPEDRTAFIEEAVAQALISYRQAFMSYLHAKGRSTSWHITGPAGRNAAREQKKHDTADRRMNDAMEVLSKTGDRIDRLVKQAAIDRAGGVGALAQQRAERIVSSIGTSAVEARAAAERAARLQAQEATEDADHTFETPGGLTGTASYAYSEDRLRISLDQRIPREDYEKWKQGGWRWDRGNQAFSRHLNNSAVQSARNLLGVAIPWVAEEVTQAAQQAADAAAAEVQERRAQLKQAAREGEGRLQDVLDAAMRKRARFKVGAFTPGVTQIKQYGRKTHLASFRLSYNTGGKARSYGEVIGPVICVGVVGSAERGFAVWLYPNQYYPDENIVATAKVPAAPDRETTTDTVARVVETAARLVKQWAAGVPSLQG